LHRHTDFRSQKCTHATNIHPREPVLTNIRFQKKGAKVQKHVAQLSSQVAAGGTPEQKRKEAEKLKREQEKKAAEQAKAEVAALFKPVTVQKVPFGVDPKSVLCVHFKAGHCEKGRLPPIQIYV